MSGETKNVEMKKKRYVKLTQLRVSSIQPLDDAIEEIREAFKNAFTTDVIEIRFLDLSDDEYAALPEFSGY
ncbi:MAG: hypothetical protein WC712_09430 [Candidatus Brocadiia bacterium]